MDVVLRVKSHSTIDSIDVIIDDKSTHRQSDNVIDDSSFDIDADDNYRTLTIHTACVLVLINEYGHL